MKIAVITCYFDPDYIRARTLRAGLKQVPGVKTIIVKNSQTGTLRYPEIIWKLWKVKRDQKPDAYLLTFRGQEILPLVLFIARKKPVIFDEFIVPIAYATNEKHHKSLSIRIKYFLARTSEPFYRRWLRRSKVILADTASHAELSARTSHMNLRKYFPIPVGADEKLFQPAKKIASEKFRVFYWSTGMQPLHGIPVVLEAAELLKDNENIEFVLAGGKKPMAEAVAASVSNGAHIEYHSWIPFNDLANIMHSSGVCLGGPFGNTQQANHVITGKTYMFLASQVPVLVGASDATKEYFADKENALVVSQGDAVALAKSINWAYKHPAELDTIAQNGRKLYDKQFSVKAISQQLQSVVDAIS